MKKKKKKENRKIPKHFFQIKKPHQQAGKSNCLVDLCMFHTGG